MPNLKPSLAKRIEAIVAAYPQYCVEGRVCASWTEADLLAEKLAAEYGRDVIVMQQNDAYSPPFVAYVFRRRG